MGQRLFDLIKVLPQYCLPKHWLTHIIYRLTRIEQKTWKNLLISRFIHLYNVDMSQAIHADADVYASFNAFFTRQLAPTARSWDKHQAHILSPVDGAISQIGDIDQQQILQAKGKRYSLPQLLANDQTLVDRFINGKFACLYLSPRDYHRIHMPMDGKLIKTVYVPGKLFAVNNPTVRTINAVFARNERFISVFDTPHGLLAQIMVGALFVGSMETVFAGQITPSRHREITIQDQSGADISLKQGDEFGHFNMGSTVILLFEQGRVNWNKELKAGDAIQVGQLLGKA